MSSAFDDRVPRLLERYDPDLVGGSPWSLTPQMAFRLIVAAETIHDSCLDDPNLFDEDNAIPRSVLAKASDEFLERQRRCYADLATKIVEGTLPSDLWSYLPACVGEEVALAHVLRVARDDYESGHLDEIFDVELGRLATDQALDTNFDFFEDQLFEDRDFEVLWSAELDGIENDEAVAIHMRYVNLHPSRWFLPL